MEVRSASRDGRFIPRKEPPACTLWTKDKSLAPCENQTTVPRSSSPWSNHAADYVIQATVSKRQIIKRKKLQAAIYKLLAHFTAENAVHLYSVGEVPSLARKTYRHCQIHEFLSLHDLLSTGRHLLGVSSIKSHTHIYAEL
jgi:hypothetical protein